MEKKEQTINISKIGSRIRALRERFGLSREKFAEIVGLSSYYIGQIERGDRTMSLETLIKISTSLNVSNDFILKGLTYCSKTNIAMNTIEENYKDELDDEIKEILSLLSGASKEDIVLVKEIIKLILPRIYRDL